MGPQRAVPGMRGDAGSVRRFEGPGAKKKGEKKNGAPQPPGGYQWQQNGSKLTLNREKLGLAGAGDRILPAHRVARVNID